SQVCRLSTSPRSKSQTSFWRTVTNSGGTCSVALEATSYKGGTHMAYQEQELQNLLGLKSVVVETIKFGEFLKRLKDNPEIGDTAAATLVRAIESKGEVDIKTAPEALRPHLTMLKKMGVPSWKAFKKVRGSQRT